jgi:branched-chain amino acid transport system substrate-binding protein
MEDEETGMDMFHRSRPGRRTKVLAVTALLAVAGALSACGSGSSSGTASGGSGGTITIGTDLPLTGAVAGQAQQLLAGYKMGISDVNAAGGIDGKKLVLDVKDDKFDPSLAANVVKQLITQDHVTALLGTFGSAGGLTTSAVAEQYQIPIVHTFVSDPQITGQDFKYTFNLFHLASQIEPVTDQFIATQPDLKTVGIVHLNLGWTEAGASASVKALQASGRQVVANVSVPTGQSDYTAALSKIRAANPDVIKLIAYDGDVATMVKQIKQLQMHPKMLYIEGDPTVNPAVTQALGSGSEGLIGTPNWFPGDTAFPTANKIAARYQKSSGNPPSTEVIKGYQGVQVLAAALKQAGSTDHNAIRDALSALQLVTVLGSVKFESNGQADSPVTLAQYQKNLKLVTLWPKNLANGTFSPMS